MNNRQMYKNVNENNKKTPMLQLLLLKKIKVFRSNSF